VRYRIRHTTEYQYSALVSECRNVAHLIPQDGPAQSCLASRVRIEPSPAEYSERLDFFGNRTSHFSVQQPHWQLSVSATSEVETQETSNELALHSAIPWEEAGNRIRRAEEPDTLEHRQFLLDSPLVTVGPILHQYALTSFEPGRPAVEAVYDLMERIHRDFEYDPGFTTISTPLSQVLEHRRGVCQDFVHLAVGCLRSVGLPARYVSGYIETIPPPGEGRLIGADASHAWFSVYIPEEGWLEFDPTNNQMPMDQHIAVAYGRDFSDVTPVKGVIFGGGEEHELTVSVDVEALI
jgi:transglutaminase-like putative cysteine protease